MRKSYSLVMLTLLFSALLFIPALSAQVEKDESENADWNRFKIGEDLTLKLNGYLDIYHIRNHNCYFGNRNAAFTEISTGLGVDFDFGKEFSGQARIVGTGLYGRPENYLGTAPMDMDTLFDLANVTYKTELFERPIKLKVGLQHLEYGDGFLVYDGYSETRAIWTTPIRSFPAIKATFDIGENNWIDVFAAHVRDTFVSQEGYLINNLANANTGGSLAGFNLHLMDKIIGTVDFGFFRKDEKKSSLLGSDTLALSLRDEKVIGPMTFTGDIVRQYG